MRTWSRPPRVSRAGLDLQAWLLEEHEFSVAEDKVDAMDPA
jgi:hypothetical protein